MSKDQKSTFELPVETVENLKTIRKILGETQSMIEFWHMENIWPINLAMDCLRKCWNILDSIIVNNSVSVSHIIDK